MRKPKVLRPLSIVGSVILVVVVWNLGKSVYSIYKIGSQVDTLEKEVESLRSEKERVLAEKLYKESLDYVEKEARDKLNLRKSEDVIVSIDNSNQDATSQQTISDTPSLTSPSIQWLTLFLRGLK